MQQTEHTCSSGQLFSWRTPDAPFVELNEPLLKGNKRKSETGQTQGYRCCSSLVSSLPVCYFTITKDQKRGPCKGSSAQASRITTGVIICPHQPFYKKNTFNPKNMMPWNPDHKNKYADMKNDPSGR